MTYRHEWKHAISYLDLLTIRQRMAAIAQPDPHARDGRYLVRSLYFDTPEDRALLEKLNGVSRREKFRIRLYNGDLTTLHLEKKFKQAGLGTKHSAPLSPREVAALLEGDTDWMQVRPEPLLQEFYQKFRAQRLRPKTVVDYTREPFIYAPGNVRVTLDYDLRTALGSTDLLDPALLTIPAGDAPILLEVKWDAYLPSIIRDAVQLHSRRSAPFSKYAQCRIYG